MGDSAEQLHQSGRLREAETAYRARLASDPNDALALRGLGIIAGQTGHVQQAAALLQRSAAFAPDDPRTLNPLGLMLLAMGRFEDAILVFRRVTQIEPGFPDAHNSLGAALKRKGDIAGARAAYEQALRLRPDFPEAANNLAITFQEQGNLERAVELYQQAIASRPNYPEALSNLGNALRLQGQLDESILAFRQAASLQPQSPEIQYNLGIALQQKGLIAESIAAYRRALQIRPTCVEALNNLGNALQQEMDFAGAAEVYRQAIALKPDLADAHNNLGRALKDLGLLDEAMASYRKAIEIVPGHADAHSNLGNALRELGQLEAAEAEFSAALSADPNFAEAGWNLGLLSLLRGDFERGFEAYELRNKVKESYVDPQFLRSFWDGSDLSGRTILLLAEQGLGDTIHFIRYVPQVRARGGRVMVLAQPRLVKLLTAQPGIDRVLTVGEEIPPFDVTCPLMSLPRVLRTTLRTIPNEVPYLVVDAGKADAWKAKLSLDRPNVGLVWAGNPTYRNDRLRSIELRQWEPILRTPGINWISLQKGPAATQARDWPIADYSERLADLQDTAALVSRLDLVIAVDTAVAHLAGALGRPTWMLIPFAPDWRWMLDREDSPWYPTMRLFRQPSRGDWTTPIEKLAAQLRALADEGKLRS
jgi:tetratricopeptide (TPR) repeat protein